jgi:hypothetical protein
MASSSLIVGACVGLIAGAILVLLSLLVPKLGTGKFIQENEHSRVFGKRISRREAHLLGILLHLVLSAIFGLFFAIFIELAWLSGYQFIPMLFFVAALTLVTGFIIMPLEGHGLFGKKHDAWFMVDALLTNLIWGHLVLFLVRLWIIL